MSLINDALKRTKEAQQQQPSPTGGPELKPVDPAVAKAASSSKTLLYVMVACVIVGNLLIFLYVFSNERAAKQATAARSAQTAAMATTAPAPNESAPAASHTVEVVHRQVTTGVQPAPVIEVAANPLPAQAAETNAATAAAAPPPIPEQPKPAPLRLQSIMLDSSKPVAMVSGKFLSIGDKVQGFVVTAIDQETVTLVGNGQTNVLSLP